MRRILPLLLLLAPFASLAAQAAPKGFFAAAGKADITPDLEKETIWLAGYGAKGRRAVDVHDPLHVRAVVVSDGEKTVALVAVDSLGIFRQVGWYWFTIAFGLSLHFLVALPLIYWLLTRRSPIPHYRAMFAPMQLAFSTSSSSATLPVTMRAVEKEAGVSNRVASFVLPLGSTVNMDGTALYECAGVLFIAQALGAELSILQQIVVVITALLASIGAAGIPSAGLVMIFIVLEAVNLNNDAAYALVGLMLGVDRPLDMFRTMVNVTSDSIGAAIIAHSEGETLTYGSEEGAGGEASATVSP